eukprot:COSAG01_NODE_10_length_42970_cov_93.010007_29_plen_101_part_00
MVPAVSTAGKKARGGEILVIMIDYRYGLAHRREALQRLQVRTAAAAAGSSTAAALDELQVGPRVDQRGGVLGQVTAAAPCRRRSCCEGGAGVGGGVTVVG